MATEESPDYTVHRFEAMAVSKEFLDGIKGSPELSTCEVAQIGNKRLEGPKAVLTASSLEEIKQKLPAIVAQTGNQGLQFILIHRWGECHTCAESKTLCTHLGKTILSHHESWAVDADKIPQTQQTA